MATRNDLLFQKPQNHSPDLVFGDNGSVAGGFTDLGIFDTFDGSELFVSLETQLLITLSAWSGGSSSIELTSFPITYFSIFCYSGEDSAYELYVEKVLNFDLFSGEDSSYSLTTFPTALLNFDLFSGEDSSYSLTSSALFQIEQFDGSEQILDLSIFPQPGSNLFSYSGEELTLGLEFFPGFALTVYSGETVDFPFNTTVSITVDNFSGEEVSFSPSFYQPSSLSFDAFTGETATIGYLAGSIIFPVMFAYQGEEAGNALDIRPASGIALQMLSGETTEIINFSLGANLGIWTFSTGEETSISYLDTEPNIYAYNGEEALIVLATSPAFVFSVYSGDEFAISFDTRPSEGVAHFVYDGQASSFQLKILPQIPLQFFTYSSIESHMGLPALGTSFDLNDSCCGPSVTPLNGAHNIEMSYAEEPDQRFDGDRVNFQFDLSARPRFKFTAYDGVAFEILPRDPTMGLVQMGSGEICTLNLESHIDFRLCPGNFIPNGTGLLVELDAQDTTVCDGFNFYDGSSAGFKLSASIGIVLPATEGIDSRFDLTSYEPWLFEFFSGEHMFLPSEAKLDYQLYSGEYTLFDFYEPPINNYSGELAQFAITITYDVKLKDVGCLDNEYIPMTENGDADFEKFNPVPVEFDNYQHDIKAECS